MCAAREGAVFRVDRIASIAPAGHREPATPPRFGNGFADATSETLRRSSVFFFAVAL